MVKKRSSGNTKPTYKEENGDLPWKFTHGMEKKKRLTFLGLKPSWRLHAQTYNHHTPFGVIWPNNEKRTLIETIFQPEAPVQDCMPQAMLGTVVQVEVKIPHFDYEARVGCHLPVAWISSASNQEHLLSFFFAFQTTLTIFGRGGGRERLDTQ